MFKGLCAGERESKDQPCHYSALEAFANVLIARSPKHRGSASHCNFLSTKLKAQNELVNPTISTKENTEKEIGRGFFEMQSSTWLSPMSIVARMRCCYMGNIFERSSTLTFEDGGNP